MTKHKYIRKTYWITKEQEKAVKKESKRSESSESAVIRELIDFGIK